jgi:hypothetical protein
LESQFIAQVPEGLIMPDQTFPPSDEKRRSRVASARTVIFDPDNFREVIRPLNVMLIAASGIFLALLLLICVLQLSKPGIWNLLLVAMGGMGTGGLLGFIYGSYGTDVSTRFGPVFSLIGGLLTGATITDLAKEDSGISRCLNSLAIACGLNAGGLIFAVICTFGAAGFLLMYINLGLTLSVYTGQLNKYLEQLRTLRIEVTSRETVRHVPIVDTENRRGTMEVDKSVTTAAVSITAIPGAGVTGSADKLLDDARAYATLKDHVMVEMALRNAIKQRPNDTRIMYDLGLHLLFSITGREAESIPYLEEVVQNPDAPAIAWKNLGFACLWGATTLRRSIEVTHKYLELYPHDKEAKLWLAAAQARLISPQDEEKRKELLAEVSALVKDDPFMRQRILEEAADGEDDDFARWRGDPGFLELLATGARGATKENGGLP